MNQLIDAAKALLDAVTSRFHCENTPEVRALRAAVEAAEKQSVQKPFAYYVHFPEEQRGEFVNNLDDLLDDMTNFEHIVTPLYSRPQQKAKPCPTCEALARTVMLDQVGHDDYYKKMFESAVSTLAEIDRLLGIGDDGCGSPQQTIAAVNELVGKSPELAAKSPELGEKP